MDVYIASSLPLPVRGRVVTKGNLDEPASRTDEEFLGDFVAMGGLQHHLLLAVETVLGLGSHVISSEGYEPPATYADVFRILANEGLLDEGRADDLMAIARSRPVPGLR